MLSKASPSLAQIQVRVINHQNLVRIFMLLVSPITLPSVLSVYGEVLTPTGSTEKAQRLQIMWMCEASMYSMVADQRCVSLLGQTWGRQAGASGMTWHEAGECTLLCMLG